MVKAPNPFKVKILIWGTTSDECNLTYTSLILANSPYVQTSTLYLRSGKMGPSWIVERSSFGYRHEYRSLHRHAAADWLTS